MVNQTQAKFFHHLYDVIVLLGGNLQIANMVKNPDDINDADVITLMSYAGSLIDLTKNRLSNINTIKIRVGNM